MHKSLHVRICVYEAFLRERFFFFLMDLGLCVAIDPVLINLSAKKYIIQKRNWQNAWTGLNSLGWIISFCNWILCKCIVCRRFRCIKTLALRFLSVFFYYGNEWDEIFSKFKLVLYRLMLYYMLTIKKSYLQRKYIIIIKNYLTSETVIRSWTLITDQTIEKTFSCFKNIILMPNYYK